MLDTNAIRTEQQDRQVIAGEVLRMHGFNPLKQGMNDLPRLTDRQGSHQFEQPLAAEHAAIGIAGFIKGIGVADDDIPHIQLDLEGAISGSVHNAQRHIARIRLDWFKPAAFSDRLPRWNEGDVIYAKIDCERAHG